MYTHMYTHCAAMCNEQCHVSLRGTLSSKGEAEPALTTAIDAWNLYTARERVRDALPPEAVSYARKRAGNTACLASIRSARRSLGPPLRGPTAPAGRAGPTRARARAVNERQRGPRVARIAPAPAPGGLGTRLRRSFPLSSSPAAAAAAAAQTALARGIDTLCLPPRALPISPPSLISVMRATDRGGSSGVGGRREEERRASVRDVEGHAPFSRFSPRVGVNEFANDPANLRFGVAAFSLALALALIGQLGSHAREATSVIRDQGRKRDKGMRGEGGLNEESGSAGIPQEFRFLHLAQIPPRACALAHTTVFSSLFFRFSFPFLSSFFPFALVLIAAQRATFSFSQRELAHLLQRRDLRSRSRGIICRRKAQTTGRTLRAATRIIAPISAVLTLGRGIRRRRRRRRRRRYAYRH